MPCPPLIRAFLVSMLALFCGGCVGLIPLYHSAKSIEGRIIDSDTKKSIEGVVVTANWQLDWGTNDEQMMVYETTTDSNGYFRFPAWGPISRPLDRRLSTTSSPQIIVFKSGYLPIVHYEMNMRDTYLDAERDSQWNGQTIPLISATPENKKAYDLQILLLKSGLQGLYNRQCDFRRIPRLVDALKAAQVLSPDGLPTICDKPERKD